jgi:hypothetical protein
VNGLLLETVIASDPPAREFAVAKEKDSTVWGVFDCETALDNPGMTIKF